jgi:hypothetical protein
MTIVTVPCELAAFPESDSPRCMWRNLFVRGLCYGRQAGGSMEACHVGYAVSARKGSVCLARPARGGNCPSNHIGTEYSPKKPGAVLSQAVETRDCPQLKVLGLERLWLCLTDWLCICLRLPHRRWPLGRPAGRSIAPSAGQNAWT